MYCFAMADIHLRLALKSVPNAPCNILNISHSHFSNRGFGGSASAALTISICSMFFSIFSSAFAAASLSAWILSASLLASCISWRLTKVYTPEPNNTTALLTHHKNGFISLKYMVAITVWAHAFAVPDMLWVRGEVTWICNPVTYPMANPNSPPMVIMNQNCPLNNLSKWITVGISPNISIKGMNRIHALTLLYRVSFQMFWSTAGRTFLV